MTSVPSQRPIDYAYYFPWTRLLRSFRIATDPRKLALAAAAVTLFWCGDAALRMLPFAPENAAPPAPPWNAVTPSPLVRWSAGAPTLYDAPASHLRSLAGRVVAPLDPLLGVASVPFRAEQSWPQVAFVWTRLFWGLGVWALFGGAIARIAAIEFARDERIGPWPALKFSLVRFVSLFSAPLLPLLGVLVLWGLCALGGLTGRIPYAGEWVVAALWGLAAVASLLLLLVVIATAAGWPLMVAALAAEGSDAFDGFSRAFSYLYGRPWLFVWYAALAIALGVALVAVIDTVALGVVSGTARTVATGMGEPRVEELHRAAPAYLRAGAAYPLDRPGATDGPINPAARLAGVWLAVIAALAVGFAASYFWTAATVAYFLLRRADDATHFDEVWLGEREEQDDLLPLAGIASTGQPITERPHHPTVGPPVATP